jgi:hypothetical protein
VTGIVYSNNKEIMKLMLDLSVDGLLNGWVSDLMDESLSCEKIWLKKVIAVVQKGIKLAENSAILSSAFVTIVVSGKIPLKINAGSAGCDFKKSSFSVAS